MANIGGSWFQSTKAAVATLTTALAGTNNDLKYTSKAGGPSTISVRYVVSGVSTPLTVAVVGQAITVNVATNGASAATSTATQVKAAVDGSGPASALVSVANAGTDDGTGVVAAFGPTTLTGGANRRVARGSGALSVRRSTAGKGQLTTA